jgi:hypothetical protein
MLEVFGNKSALSWLSGEWENYVGFFLILYDGFVLHHRITPLNEMIVCLSFQFPDYLPCSVMLQPAPQDVGKVS